MIEVKGLCLHYAGAAGPTLEGVDLEVAAGEVALVTGPTGCGKSSLLNCLNGVLQHESSARVEGTVLLDGEDVRGLELAEICRIAGTVFQNPESQISTATPETWSHPLRVRPRLRGLELLRIEAAVTAEGDCFEVSVPAAFLRRNSEAVASSWIDFYRR